MICAPATLAAIARRSGRRGHDAQARRSYGVRASACGGALGDEPCPPHTTSRARKENVPTS